MPGQANAGDLIFILGVAILLFGHKLVGKSWEEMADVVAQAMRRFKQGDTKARMDAAMVRGLTVLAIVCVVLLLELSWLATRL